MMYENNRHNVNATEMRSVRPVYKNRMKHQTYDITHDDADDKKVYTWRRYVCPIYLLFFQFFFIVLIGIFGNYDKTLISGTIPAELSYQKDAFVYASKVFDFKKCSWMHKCILSFFRIAWMDVHRYLKNFRKKNRVKGVNRQYLGIFF